MKTGTKIAMGIGSLALVALLAWALAPRPVEVEVATARVGAFEHTITEDGKTRLRERYVVSAPLIGRLSRIVLTEGDRVDENAVVAVLTPVLSPMLDERSRREQTAHLAASEANVQRALARIARTHIALDQARNDLQRTEQLARQGFVAPIRLDNERLAVQAAQREVEAAVQEHHVAQHELEQARAALLASRGAAATGSSGAFELRSPIAGRVLRVVQTSEATVAVGSPLIELGDLGRMEIVVELLTTDALNAPPGSRVRIELWGGPVPLEGRVRLVEPAAFTKVSALGVEEQRVRVLIDITSPPSQWQALGDGFRVEVHIVTLALEQALTVPVSAVFPLPSSQGAGEPRFGVFVVNGGRARLTPIEIGARNGSEAWVRGGIDPNTSVVVYPSSNVGDGTRVSARRV
ncbi:MAG: HlyD family efflux transporter periplasmic adaptor subunit [Pseudomonadota bacterium]|nr:HlyD family efflux transporter periplasmic adaptor subunit [Pseudomonadota bacterium]